MPGIVLSIGEVAGKTWSLSSGGGWCIVQWNRVAEVMGGGESYFVIN